jgi:dienelactone hydrolase
MSRGDAREFLLVVPPTYTPTRRYPVIFGFHWLSSSANSVVRDAEIESAVAQFEFIAVLPENLETNGRKAYQFDWPFVEAGAFAAKEQAFFEDVLACVSQQFTVDPSRVHVFGASAGGLWAAYLSTTPTVNRIASVLSISGGLGQENLSGLWRTDFVPQSNKFPALVVWGGQTDFFILNFDLASRRYRDALRADRHFVAQCVHSAGHGVPPYSGPSDGGTRFPLFWEFFRDHPYGLSPNSSPYQGRGLPPSFPNGCTIVP